MLCYALLEKMEALVPAPAFANLLNVLQTERQLDVKIDVAQEKGFYLCNNLFDYVSTSGSSISCQSSSQWLRQPEKRRIVLLVQIGLGSFIDKRQTQIIKGFLGCHCQPF